MLTPLSEGARVPIDLSQDGLQAVAAGTSSRVLLQEGILDRKMSLAAFREYSMTCFSEPGSRNPLLQCCLVLYVEGLLIWKAL